MSIQNDTVDLGPVSEFTKLPAQISLDNESYWLVNGRKGYLLLSSICPHAGGKVVDQGKDFLCYDHGWRFEYTQGECVNGPRARMYSFPVTVQNGRLIVEMVESA